MKPENPYSANDLHQAWDEGFKAADEAAAEEVEQLRDDVVRLGDDLAEAHTVIREQPEIDTEPLTCALADLAYAIRSGGECKPAFLDVVEILRRGGVHIEPGRVAA